MCSLRAKLASINGLWIGITPPMLPKLTMVKEASIAHFYCHTILVKLRYTNIGGITCQHALKINIISFVQNLENAIKLLDRLPSSLKSLINTIVIHFVGSS
jgi:hypothetical protein